MEMEIWYSKIVIYDYTWLLSSYREVVLCL